MEKYVHQNMCSGTKQNVAEHGKTHVSCHGGACDAEHGKTWPNMVEHGRHLFLNMHSKTCASHNMAEQVFQKMVEQVFNNIAEQDNTWRNMLSRTWQNQNEHAFWNMEKTWQNIAEHGRICVLEHVL